MSTDRSNETTWVKLTSAKYTNKGVVFREGLNVDKHPLNTDDDCCAGGIYFTRLEHAHLWVHLNGGMTHIWDVKLPKGEPVVEYECKAKAHRIILSNPRPIPQAIWLAAVRVNGMLLQYLRGQTPEICLAAVQQNGRALQYVKDQTPEICTAAVQ